MNRAGDENSSAARHLSWCAQPMLFAALFFAGGVTLVKLTTVQAWRPPSWLLIASVVLLAIASYWIRRRTVLSFLVVLSSFFLFGSLDYELRLNRYSVSIPPEIFNVPSEIFGTVTRSNLLTTRAPSQGWRSAVPENRQLLDFETDKIVIGDHSYSSTIGIKLAIYSQDDYGEDEDAARQKNPSTFHYGQRLRLKTKLRQPRNFNNPGAWDYREYLSQQGISALASAKVADVELLSGAGGTWCGRIRSTVRESLIRHILMLNSSSSQSGIRGWIQLSADDAALLIAMTLGDRTLLQRNIKTDFQKTGAYHLLVVSGMNVAILAFAVFWLARSLRVGEIAATIFTILLAAFYAYLTDLGAPIERAVLMSSVYLCTRLLYRERQSLNAVGVAALGVLVWDPAALFDAGFQLTFLAVLTIGGIGIPLLERSSGPLRSSLRPIDSLAYDIRLQPRQAQFRIELRMIAERVSYFMPQRFAVWLLCTAVALAIAIFDLVLMSLLMQSALALPMAIYFHRVTAMGLPANVLVVPLISLLMPVALMTTLASYVGAWLAFVPKFFTAIILHGITGVIALLSRFNAANIRVADPPFWIALVCMLAISWCLLVVRWRRVVILSALGALFISAALLVHPKKPRFNTGQLEVTAIDVGQGDSILVITPESKTLLIDGGGTLGASSSEFDFGEDVVSPYLWSRGFEHLDAVALTHAHGDHISGLASVVANFKPDELWIAPSALTSAYRNLMQLASADGSTVLRRTAGEKFDFGGAQIEVLWPPTDWHPGRDRNADSMILRIAYGQSAVLLEGDAVARNERQITQLNPRAQLLKVGHHGSNTSTTPELLTAVQPKYAIISAGAQNPFGHPRPEVLQRLANTGAHTFRTDVQGAVSFFLDGKQVKSVSVGGQQMAVDLQQNQSH